MTQTTTELENAGGFALSRRVCFGGACRQWSTKGAAVLGVMGALMLVAGAARAQESVDPSTPFRRETSWEAQPFLLLGHLGLSAPIGVTGITLDYAANRWFVVAGGAGTNARSYELEGETKVRLVFDETLATGAGLGLAYGQPQSWCYHAFDPPTCNAPDPVPSAFFELYMDARSAQGIVARFYGGALEPFWGDVQSTFLGLHMTWIAPYVGIAFGRAM
jgi:hypothetical protein